MSATIDDTKLPIRIRKMDRSPSGWAGIVKARELREEEHKEEEEEGIMGGLMLGKCWGNGSQSMDSEATIGLDKFVRWLRSGSVWEG